MVYQSEESPVPIHCPSGVVRRADQKSTFTISADLLPKKKHIALQTSHCTARNNFSLDVVHTLKNARD
jgi:hypothetical protein